MSSSSTSGKLRKMASNKRFTLSSVSSNDAAYEKELEKCRANFKRKKGKKRVNPAYLSMLNDTIGPGGKVKTGAKKAVNSTSSTADGGATPNSSGNADAPKINKRKDAKSRSSGRLSKDGGIKLAVMTPEYMKVKEEDSIRQKKDRTRCRNKIMNQKTAKGQRVFRGQINLMLDKKKADLNVASPS